MRMSDADVPNRGRCARPRWQSREGVHTRMARVTRKERLTAVLPLPRYSFHSLPSPLKLESIFAFLQVAPMRRIAFFMAQRVFPRTVGPCAVSISPSLPHPFGSDTSRALPLSSSSPPPLPPLTLPTTALHPTLASETKKRIPVNETVDTFGP